MRIRKIRGRQQDYEIGYERKCVFCGYKTNWFDAICGNCYDKIPDHIPRKQHLKFKIDRGKKYGKPIERRKNEIYSKEKLN